jgi:hypothetical protein
MDIKKYKKTEDLLFIWDATRGGARCRGPLSRPLPGHCTLGGTTPVPGVRRSADHKGRLKGGGVYYLSCVGWVLVQMDARAYKMMSNIAGGIGSWKYWSMVRKCAPISRAFAMLTFTTGWAHV